MSLNTKLFIRYFMNGIISLITSVILMFAYANLLTKALIDSIQQMTAPMVSFDMMLIVILLVAMLIISWIFQMGLKTQLAHQRLIHGYLFWINLATLILMILTLILAILGTLNVITNLIMNLGILLCVIMTFVNLFKVIQTHQISWYWWGITNQMLLVITFFLLFWLMPM